MSCHSCLTILGSPRFPDVSSGFASKHFVHMHRVSSRDHARCVGVRLGYCTISTTSSVTGHKWPWTEPMYKIVMVMGHPWTCYETRCLFIIIKDVNVLPLAVGLLWVSCSLRCHFCTIFTNKQPYFVGQIVIIYEPWTCHELENFLSQIMPAYESMNLGVMGHTTWTSWQTTVVHILGIF